MVKLVEDPLSSPSPGNRIRCSCLPAHTTNQAYFTIRPTRLLRAGGTYRYSNLAHWPCLRCSQSGLGGITAIGWRRHRRRCRIGQCLLSGMIAGTSTVTGPWGWDGETAAARQRVRPAEL